MDLSPQQFARRDGSSTKLRSDALRLSWRFDDVLSADSHSLHIRFSCSGQIADTEADRRMFHEVFLASSPAVHAVDVTNHFNTALRAAASGAASRLAAARCVGEASAEMQSALLSAAKPVAFACGMELLPPYQIEISSPSLDRAGIESMHRAQAEQRVAGQVQHLQRAAELLKQFRSLREQMPELSAGQILQQVNAADRGSTLQSLLMASAKESPAQCLWAVAGPTLVKIDTTQLPPRCQMIPLPTSAGPLRSVQPATINGRRMLLVGARLGVIVVPPDSPAEALVYLDSSVKSQLGFNRAVGLRNEEIWASHGEAGVVGWRIGQVDGPFVRFDANPGAEQAVADLPGRATAVSTGGSPSLITAGSPSSRPTGPRNLQSLDAHHLVWSIGSDLRIAGSGEPQTVTTGSKLEIVAILPDERSLLVVHADSFVAVLSRESRRIVDQQRRAGRVTAAAALPWLGGMRMLLIDGEGPIDCVGFDDPLITQFASSHRGLRVVAASRELVAAVSSDRQRLVLWRSWDGHAPLAELHITGMARHRVADVEFG